MPSTKQVAALAGLVEAVRDNVRPGDDAYEALWGPMAEADRVLTDDQAGRTIEGSEQ